MAGRNVIGVAETGSGKTLAYLLPMLRHVMAQPPLAQGDGPISLVIGPTRELAQQIAHECRRFMNPLKLRCALVYGGGRIGTQLSEIKRGAEVVVGTPGRLTEILTINKGRVLTLERVTFIVLDEADRMFDLGFGPQVERIVNNVRPDRQIAMFSATFPSHIENLAQKALYKPLEIIVGAKGRSATTVTQIAEVFPNIQVKFERLLKVLGEWYEHGESIIIFCNRQTEVDELNLQLLRMGYPSLTLHGGQDQEERELALDDFKHKRKTILIATSIASRGLDVRSVVLVINYWAPDHLEDYVHRVGRTGRAGNIGVAFTFFVPQEADRADDVIRALVESGQQVPESLKALAESHAAQVEVGLAKTRKLKGFGGRGYKFIKAEQSAQQQAKQFWKKELGIGETIEKEDEAEVAADMLDNPMGPMPSPCPGSAETLSDSAGTGGGAGNVSGGPTTTAPLSKISTAPTIPSSNTTGATTASATATNTTTTTGAVNEVPSMLAGVSQAALSEVEERANALLDVWTRAILDPVKKELQKKALMPTIRQLVAQQQFPSSISSALALSGRAAAGVLGGSDQAAGLGAQQRLPDVSAMVKQALQPLQSGPQPKQPTAHQVAAAVAAKQLVSNQQGPSEYVDPVTGNYVCTLSINDYPAQARHRVSHRETLSRISDLTDATLQVRGVYLDPEKRKQNPLQYITAKELHVEIIAPTQLAAHKARRELKMMLETIAKKQLNLPHGARC